MRIELRRASRRWGPSVGLREVDLSLEPGERVAFLGPSGSGKTTLLRLIAGTLRANGGAVVVDGRNLDRLTSKQLRSHRRRCAFLGQGDHCLDQLSVHANVVSGMLQRWPWHRVVASTVWPMETESVAQLLGQLGIRERQWDAPDALSGGQRQRVALARALAAEADVMLLDEPTSALDPEIARLVLDVVQERHAPGRLTLISTHRASEVKDRVDRVVGLANGEIAFDCESAALTTEMTTALYTGSRELV